MGEPDATTQPASESYASAVEELDEIVAELDGEDVDVDELAAKVARAGELIAFCRERIDASQREVQAIIGRLAPTDD